MAKKIDFTWSPADDIDFYQLFEDGEKVVDNIVDPNFSLLMDDIDQGEHTYQVRGVNQFGEGALSDPVTINFILPAKIENLRFTIV